VHGGTLYSCANQILVGKKPYHVEKNGEPADDAIFMAKYVNGSLLVLDTWSRQFMTLKDHFESFYDHMTGTEYSKVLKVKYVQSAEGLKDLHKENLAYYNRVLLSRFELAQKAKKRSTEHMNCANETALMGLKYAKAFGYDSDAKWFRKVAKAKCPDSNDAKQMAFRLFRECPQ
jgi:hypothetical protein